jgi:hypothetical protein
MSNKFLSFVYLFFLGTVVKGQKVLPNTLIGKSEIEFSTSFLGSNYSEISLGEIIYRVPVSKNLKLGGGAKIFWGNLNDSNLKQFNVYPAVFFDAQYFIGKAQRQKWSISFQTGYDFFKKKIGDYHGIDTGFYTVRNSVLKTSLYATIGASHRAILSKKVQLVTGGFLSLQRTNQKGEYTNINGTRNFSDKQNNLGGIFKVGLVIRLGK